ncbi:MAG TPA: U32 family peptidase [Thermoanaerobacterales bacterium]|jgi:putative protease|nr:U32 family peptidase [Thermoanaerobacterales bacterium]
MTKPELLIPAGNMEKLEFAIKYGADAVYLGGKNFSLRAGADNFSYEEMKEAVDFAHIYGKKAYITLNIIPHNKDLEHIFEYITYIANIGADAVIISDPGVLEIVKSAAPNLKVHLSTQANTVNWKSCNFWHNLGVKRIVLARELSLEEIKEIRRKTPKSLELEVFIHGAMCISYSGRCLISNYMTYRESNRGMCAHPCRYKYYLMEEKRPGKFFPVFEDDRGTYFFNSKDLCMLDKIPELAELNLTSYKVEGRMKSVHYVAQVTKSYRNVIDNFYENPDKFHFRSEWMAELLKTSHREFTHGFYFDKPKQNGQIYDHSTYIRDYDFVGIIRHYDKKTKIATVEQRNPVKINDVVELLCPEKDNFSIKISKMWDDEGNEIFQAPHPNQIFKIELDEEVNPYTIIRRAKEDIMR